MPDYEREAVALENFAEWLENPPVKPWNRMTRRIQRTIDTCAESARIGAATYRKGCKP